MAYMTMLYKLVFKVPDLVDAYLNERVFPETMANQRLKLSARSWAATCSSSNASVFLEHLRR